MLALVIHHFLSAIRESRHKVLLKIGIPMGKSLKNSCEWVDLFKNLQASYDLFKVTSILIYVFIICKQLLPLNIFQWLFLSIFFLFFCFAFFVFFFYSRDYLLNYHGTRLSSHDTNTEIYISPM